jgi:hypothetical protein
MQSIVLCDLSDAVSVIDEERFNWVSDIIGALNVPEEIFDAKTIDEYRDKMSEIGVEIVLGTNGDVSVYKKTWHNQGSAEGSGWLSPTKDNLVAQWKEPTYVRKVDGNKVYYELHLNEWSSVVRNNG